MSASEQEESEYYSCPIVEGFDFGTALQNVYPILSIIFRGLPAKDLNNAAQISEVWAEYAQKELTSRRYHGQFHVIQTGPSKFRLETSPNFNLVNGECTIIFGTTKLKRYTRKLSMNRKVPLFMDITQDKELDLAHLKGYGYLVHKMFPLERRVVGHGFVVPKIDNLTVELYTNGFEKDISKVIEKGLKVRAMMYLCSRRSINGTNPGQNLTEILKHQNYKKFPLAGGYVMEAMDETYALSRATHRYLIPSHYALLFLTPPDNTTFEAYSILIIDESHTVEMLQKVKPNIILKSHSIAYIFQCIKIRVIDSAREFNLVFPTVDCTVVNCEGEIGWSSHGVFSEDDYNPKKKLKYFPVSHTFSITILILTWD
ncbi:uncharacterized protein [Onthophagus taurus]|uniref:uncharacterized protein n=1 Tax=Onthophagus taurus TaxID=166361 RepID=UPI000C1FDF9D|nr:uncharacterized protein LOC111424605 [Onthophagus taurus]